MSGFGFSPSDIVNGTKVLFRAHSALSDEGGSKETYRETSDGLALRSTALKSLDRLAVLTATTSPDSSNDLRRTVAHLKCREERKVKSLRKFEKALGSTASSCKSRAIPSKLKWAFGGEQDFREYDARAAPGIDPALIQAISLTATQTESRFQNLASQITSENAASLRRQDEINYGHGKRLAVIESQLASLSDTSMAKIMSQLLELGNVSVQLLQDIIQDNEEGPKRSSVQPMDSIETPKSSVTTQLSSNRRGMRTESWSGMLSPPSQSALVDRHPSVDDTTAANLVPTRNRISDSGQSVCMKDNLDGSFGPNKVPQTPMASQFRPGKLVHSQAAAIHPSTRTGTILTHSDCSILTKDLLNSGVLIVACILYGTPHSRRALHTLSSHLPQDPMFLSLLVLASFYILKCFRHLPQQISLLRGDYIAFEDALGDPMEVPSSTCRHPKIFRAFLEVHFEYRPGLEKVLMGQYNLMLGGRRGRQLTDEDWALGVKNRSKITMAMVIATNMTMCLQCYEMLQLHSEHEYLCASCDRFYGVSKAAPRAPNNPAGTKIQTFEWDTEVNTRSDNRDNTADGSHKFPWLPEDLNATFSRSYDWEAKIYKNADFLLPPSESETVLMNESRREGLVDAQGNSYAISRRADCAQYR